MKNLIFAALLAAFTVPATADTGHARDLNPAEVQALTALLLGQYNHLPGAAEVEKCVAKFKTLKFVAAISAPSVVTTGHENQEEDDTEIAISGKTAKGYVNLSLFLGEGSLGCKLTEY